VGSPAQQQRVDGTAPVVFVIEDDVATLRLLCDVASDAGWVARGFTRLGEARARIESDPPSLVIVDDDLPDGRGGDLARDMTTQVSEDAVPVVVCTAAHPTRRAEIRSWAPVVAKPFALSEIERLLSTAARGRRRRLRPDAAG
jgi:DNA-binding response OmpR family regulator